MAENPAYLDGLLKDLEDHPLDTTLRRMIADHWEEEGDHFTADLWRFHAAVIDDDSLFQWKEGQTQRIRDVVRAAEFKVAFNLSRDTSSSIYVIGCHGFICEPHEPMKPPERKNNRIEVGLLWLIENGFVTP